MSKGSLLIHPVDPDLSPPLDALMAALKEIGLAGDAIDETHWKAGDSFLQQLTFMGCSPHVRFEPLTSDDQDYCHLSYRHFPEPVLLHSAVARPVRCRNCGKPVVSSWEQFDLAAGHWQCRHCDHLHENPQALRWRNDAGAGRFFLEIHGIYPGEAQPVDALMRMLDKLSGSPWRYFYLHQQ